MNDEPMNESDSPSFLDRIKESPRTVSALIIILIVAAAIYAFSGEPKPADQDLAQNDEVAVTDETAATDEADEDEAMDETADKTATPTRTPATTTTQPVMASIAPLTPDQLQEMNKTLPPVERADRAYVETAQAGDGITHLARRATTRWLAENNPGYTITNEHRIFIEDYIQNKTGSNGLSIGETKTISFDLIAEAVKAAGELNDQQLHNLSHYTSALN